MREMQFSKCFPCAALGAVNDCGGIYGLHHWKVAMQTPRAEEPPAFVVGVVPDHTTDIWGFCFLTKSSQFLYKICFG